ncbi:MAG: hypothetical protein MJZ01_06865, partial [Bacteroidales bacterium]|nr:hypothetical protein [Bacteroidales bacterium]
IYPFSESAKLFQIFFQIPLWKPVPTLAETALPLRKASAKLDPFSAFTKLFMQKLFRKLRKTKYYIDIHSIIHWLKKQNTL